MEAVTFILTTAGRNALVNALHTGVQDVVITEVGYGSASYVPTPEMTSLHEEIKRVPARAAQNVGDGIISINALDDSSDAYAVYEVGIYARVTSTGEEILFAIYSNEEALALLEKTSLSITNIDFDLFIGSAETGAIEFGDTNFLNPPATTTIAGVIMLATAEEIALGQNGNKAITPGALINALKLGTSDNVLTNVLVETLKSIVGTKINCIAQAPSSASEIEGLMASPASGAGGMTGGTEVEVLDTTPVEDEDLSSEVLSMAPATYQQSEMQSNSAITSFKLDLDGVEPGELQEGVALISPSKSNL